MEIVLKRVELAGGRVVDVRLDRTVVTEVADGLPTQGAELVLDGQGAALIPGLHDHHIHLLAGAAASRSVDCSVSLDALRTAPGSDWVRGVGYHESVAGELDGYLSAAHAPGGAVRRVAPGAPADLVLLDAPLATVLDDPSHERVRAVLAGGRWVFGVR